MAAPDAKYNKADESRQQIDNKPVAENELEKAGKGKKKKLLIILGALILLVIGGLIFAVPYFKGDRGTSEQGEEGSQPVVDESAANKQETVKATLALDSFLVNLADKDAGRFVKISFQLGLAEEPKEGELKMAVPAIRDSIITLLTSKTSEDILTPQGKDMLREQVRTRMNELSAGINVLEVYIVEFVVQI